jgi:hydroxysqualene dehydroxylase
VTGPDVAVIGGGLAGIAAALTAAESGAQVVLVEQRPHLGGAASSFRRKELWIDYGQHVFLRCCTAYRSLVERMGGGDYLFLQDRLEIPVFDGTPRPAWLRRSSLPPPLHLSRALAGYHLLSRGERLAVVRAARALKQLDPRDGSLDQTTFGRWLKEKGQSNRAIEAFWDLITRPTLNLPAQEVSLLAAARTFQIGVLTEAAAADIGWATVPLSRLHNELASQALALAGVDIRLCTRAREVASPEGRPPRVLLDDGTVLDPGAVIVAVPSGAIPALLGRSCAGIAKAVATAKTSPIVNVHLRFDRAVMAYPLAAGLSAAAQWLFDRTMSAGLRTGQYLVVSLSAADTYVRASDRSIIAAALEAAGRFLPALNQATLLDAQVTKDPAATMRVEPGTARIRALGHGSIPGVALAGAWTDTGWPPTMESAVRSGIQAAEVFAGQTGTACKGGLA